MQITGITINVMTLGGLAVAVGRVVDDAIVVLENIYRHRALGEDRMTASLRGPREVAGAITSATLTTVAVFLPLGLVGGIVQPAVPALRAHRHLRPAGVARRGPDGRAGPRLPVHREGQAQRRRGRRAEELLLDPRLHADDPARSPEPGHEVGRPAASRRSSSCSRWRSCRSCPPSSSTPARRRSCRSRSRRRPAPAPPPSWRRPIEAETILLADPEVEHVQTSVPGEGDTSFGTVTAALSGRPANSATLTVRLSADVDLDHVFAAPVDRAGPGQDQRLRRRRRPDGRLHVQRPEHRHQR